MGEYEGILRDGEGVDERRPSRIMPRLGEPGRLAPYPLALNP